MWSPVHAFFEKAKRFASFLHDAGRNEAAGIVCLLSDPEDLRKMTSLASAQRWQIAFARSRAEAERAHADIILVDRDMAGPDWRGTMTALSALARTTCIILVSRAADESLWNEVVSHGGYEILSKPLREEEVVRAIKMARNWSTVRK